MILRELSRAIVLMTSVLGCSPALSCSIALPDPPLAGESNEAYRARIAENERRQAEQWHRHRQDYALQQADTIFIARTVEWSPPVRHVSPTSRFMQRGRPVSPPRVIPPPDLEYPPSTYFKPIAWYRGQATKSVFKVQGSETTCGPTSLGDTLNSAPGMLFVFFASKGRISDDTLIDAIAVDGIDGPALQDFIKPYRSGSLR